jgi:hypothetical protein
MKNMPTMIGHLLEEWKKEAKRSRARISGKHHRSARDGQPSVESNKEAVDPMKMDVD